MWVFRHQVLRPHLSQMTQYKELHTLGQREVMGLTDEELMPQRELKGAALLQNPKFIVFQTKLMPPSIYMHIYMQIQDFSYLFVSLHKCFPHIQEICYLALDFESKLAMQTFLM